MPGMLSEGLGSLARGWDSPVGVGVGCVGEGEKNTGGGELSSILRLNEARGGGVDRQGIASHQVYKFTNGTKRMLVTLGCGDGATARQWRVDNVEGIT